MLLNIFASNNYHFGLELRVNFQVNQIIQRAAQLRLGKSKSVVISECRNSIKANNINQLIKVIKTGVA